MLYLYQLYCGSRFFQDFAHHYNHQPQNLQPSETLIYSYHRMKLHVNRDTASQPTLGGRKSKYMVYKSSCEGYWSIHVQVVIRY